MLCNVVWGSLAYPRFNINCEKFMRIVCEQCQTKYVVPDEKIVKNVLRLTCQKCGHVITTRVDAAVQNENSTPGTLNKWRASMPNTPARMQSETPTWYYSYNGESFGPFTEFELKEKLLSAKMVPIVNRCYLWKKSFTDWKPVIEVEPFASALLMPPPPSPPPAPAPVKEDGSLPPLFSFMPGGASSSSLGVKAVEKNDAETSSVQSSPDLSGLKMKLSSTGTMSDKQRESLTKLALSSNAFGSSPSASSNEHEPGEETKIKSPSPLMSFQSLDAITPDIKTEGSSGKSSGLVRPFPSLSGVAPIGRTTDGIRPSFGTTQMKSGNSSVLGAKMSDTADKPAASFGIKFPGLEETSSAVSSGSLSTIGANAPAPAAPSSISGHSGFPLSGKLASVPVDDISIDMSDEIGEIVREGAGKSAAVDTGNESISQWLPSQSELRDESGLSLSGMSLPDKVIDESSAQVSLPSIDLNIHGPESISTDRVSLPAIDMAVSCESVPAIVPGQKDAGEPCDIDLDDMGELDAELLSDIDLDDDSSQFFDRDEVNGAVKNGTVPKDADNGGHRDAAKTNCPAKPGTASSEACIPERDSSEPVMLPGAAMLAMVQGLEQAEIKRSDSVDLDEIDLDNENSNLIPPEVVKEADKAEDIFGISGLGAADDLFASEPEDSSVARVSKTKLDEIKERHSDIFAEFDEAASNQSNQEDESCEGLSENSMLIQLAHIQKMDKKEKRKSRIGLIVAICVFAVIIVGASVGGIVLQDREKEVEVQPGFASVGGQVISSDDLDVQVPDDDFEIVEAPVAEPKARVHREETKKSQPRGSATEQAAQAIYGSKDENKDDPEPQEAAVREDGRAKVALNRTDDFAKTAGIQGSKYVKGASGSSRDSLKIGLAVVGRSVQDCARRAAKNGTALPQKIYINFNIEPEGNVSSYKIADEVPENFNKCLDSKRDTWKFAPFEGSTVSIRQAFILG